MAIVILNNSHYAPRGASMTVMTQVDYWLVKIIVVRLKDTMIASLGKKFISKIFKNFDPSNVLKR